MVSTVGIDTALKQQANTKSATTGLAADFSQFLNLLTVQLKNQDPLSPMDSNEFTNQLVAFSGVEQQINANQKLDSLVALQLGNAMGSALGYVGMDVSYMSNEFNFDGASPAQMTYALDSQAMSNKIHIFNEAGKLVFETNGEKTAGKHDFTWDGKDKDGHVVPAGTYNIKVDALDEEDKAVGYSTVVSGLAHGVETQDGLLYLLVGDRAVSTGSVLNATKPRT